MIKFLPSIWKRITCKHDWILKHRYMIDAGLNQLRFYECVKCGKKERKTDWY
ncbi:hypothetical protein [Brevibacillus migulae]|uniref:hypothetical protein n=1 Tax=Brevibacillus migulae TaxID=1644114 RepID=UPI001431F49C|nr:hypothetical protein [Brevibacillus migulae]